MLLTVAVIGPAHALKGEVRLEIRTDDPEGRYAHELIGLRAVRALPGAEPQHLGEVVDLEPGVAQDRIVVRTPDGEEVAVPFVEQLVPGIDPEAGVVTLDPPGGLFPGVDRTEEAR